VKFSIFQLQKHERERRRIHTLTYTHTHTHNQPTVCSSRSNTMSDFNTTEPRLPSFFPRAPVECKAPAESFFACFTANSNKKDAMDTRAGHEGLKACTQQLSAYESCMTKSSVSNKTQSKMFRVQEEYRTLPQRVSSEK
jgi:hypothetical protein